MRITANNHCSVYRPSAAPAAVAALRRPAPKRASAAPPLHSQPPRHWKSTAAAFLQFAYQIGMMVAPFLMWLTSSWVAVVVTTACCTVGLSWVRSDKVCVEHLPARLRTFEQPRVGLLESFRYLSICTGAGAAAIYLPMPWAITVTATWLVFVFWGWEILDTVVAKKIAGTLFARAEGRLAQKQDAFLTGGTEIPKGECPERLLMQDTDAMLEAAPILTGAADKLGAEAFLRVVREYQRQCRAYRRPSRYRG